jgi:hypothetical protein
MSIQKRESDKKGLAHMHCWHYVELRFLEKSDRFSVDAAVMAAETTRYEHNTFARMLCEQTHIAASK